MSQKTIWRILTSAVAAALLAAAIAAGCGHKSETENKAEADSEIVAVVPSDGKSVIASLISEYENVNDDSEIKFINIGGTDEEVYRLCVSMLLDKKFSADVLIIDDTWLSTFADEGLVSEITDINDEVFILAARRAMTFKDKIYGIPIYADAMASFEKYGSSGETVYLEKDASDMAAHIRSGISSGLSLSEAHRAYAEASKCKAVGEFIDGDAGKLRAWVSCLDDIQKGYPKAAVNMKIKLENNALVRTKVAVINNESRLYGKALKLIEYLLSDDSQRKIMSGMPGVPIMKKNYGDVFTADRITYIENVDGEKFCTFPFAVNFYENELRLTEAAENNASYSETERLLKYVANP